MLYFWSVLSFCLLWTAAYFRMICVVLKLWLQFINIHIDKMKKIRTAGCTQKLYLYTAKLFPKFHYVCKCNCCLDYVQRQYFFQQIKRHIALYKMQDSGIRQTYSHYVERNCNSASITFLAKHIYYLNMISHRQYSVMIPKLQRCHSKILISFMCYSI